MSADARACPRAPSRGSIPCTRSRSNASARARPIALMSSASSCRSPQRSIAPRAASSSPTPRRHPANPYDGHTLATVIPEIETQIGANLTRIVADRGYRGHNAPPDHKFKVYISGQGRRVTETHQTRTPPRVGSRTGHQPRRGRAPYGPKHISPAPMATPPSPSSPPPDTVFAGSSPGSLPFGVPSSWRSSPTPETLPSQRQTAPEAHRSPR